MLTYEFSFDRPNRHILSVEITLDVVENNELLLQLPTWRPGRYELQHYAKNIISFSCVDEKGNPVFWKKTTKDQWCISCASVEVIHVKYQYYAHQLDAGGSWVDEDLIYVNPINCTMSILGREHEPHQIKLHVENEMKVACALKNRSHTLVASSYFELIDSPFIASKRLETEQYKVGETTFYIHVDGEVNPDWSRLKNDFAAFTNTQIQLFGEFPSVSYHFLFLILPHPHYHGVEHHRSTVIVLGPDKDFHNEANYTELLGISSHELFHYWNIARIRPAELLPYDLTKENYFETGYIAEGITTYYGDLMLMRSGVFDWHGMKKELETHLYRHTENYGRFAMSLTQASRDLWLDGYVAGVPNRKVSIYVEGALVSWLLDLKIRSATSGAKSLDDVVRYFWKKFGDTQTGYSTEDYVQAIVQVGGDSFRDFVDTYIVNTGSLLNGLNDVLPQFGLKLEAVQSVNWLEKTFGFRMNEKGQVVKIIPESPADAALSIQDQVVLIQNKPLFPGMTDVLPIDGNVTIEVLRRSGNKTCVLVPNGKRYFDRYTIEHTSSSNENASLLFDGWLRG